MAQDAYLQNLYQDVSYLQRGLLEAPLPGMAPDQPRTQGDVEKWTDMLHFSISGGIRYDNNVYLTHKDKVDDVIFTVSPTLMLRSAESGTALNTFSLTYTPSFNFYASETDRNSIGQYLSFRWDKQMRRSRFGLNLGYSFSSGSDRFVSGTVDRSTVRLGMTYNYLLTGKTSLALSFNTDIDAFKSNDLYDVGAYSFRVSLPYQWTGKTSIGPSFGYSYTNVSAGSPNSSTYDLGVTMTYQVSGKTTVTGNIGYNLQSYSGGNAARDRHSLSWRFAGNYQVSGKTSVSGSIYNSPKASYNFPDSGYMATGLALQASHQLSGRTSLYTMVSLENNDYFETANTAQATTINNVYYSLTFGGRYQLDNGISLGANMTWRANVADEAINDFNGFTLGLNASYNFW